MAAPVSSRSGRMSRPSACMSTMKYVMPACLGASGSVRARQMPQSAGLGHRRPHLLPVEHPAAVDAVGPGAEGGQVGAGAGLAEQLAPAQRPEQRGAHPALLLLRASRGRSCVGSAHAPTARCGRATPAAASSSSITSCSTGSGATAPRSWPVRHDQARLDQRGALGSRPAAAISATTERDLVADRVGLGRAGRWPALRRAPPAASVVTSCSSASDVASDDKLPVGHGPLEVEVRVVLPGEADAAEDLDALLGAVGGRIERDGTGDAGH